MSRVRAWVRRQTVQARHAARVVVDRGASAVEYGLMVAAIAAVIVGVVFGLGSLVKNAFSSTCDAMSPRVANVDCNTGQPGGGGAQATPTNQATP